MSVTCPGCGERNLRYYSNDTTGKKLTINPYTPRPDGNIVLVSDTIYHVLDAVEVAELEGHQSLFAPPRWQNHHRYVAHLAVCPNTATADPRRDLKAHRRLVKER